MSLWNDAGWLLVGGYHAIENSMSTTAAKRDMLKINSIAAALTDKELEEQVRSTVYNATTDEDFIKIWKRIEEFKRDNPHMVTKHKLTSFWGPVGKTRFPFTRARYCADIGKSRLTKADERMLATYRGWTITLLMNTYGKYSREEAFRVAVREVYGTGHPLYTTEYG